jgi:hypothetical protein
MLLFLSEYQEVNYTVDYYCIEPCLIPVSFPASYRAVPAEIQANERSFFTDSWRDTSHRDNLHRKSRIARHARHRVDCLHIGEQVDIARLVTVWHRDRADPDLPVDPGNAPEFSPVAAKGDG